jgi:1-acyl-sn-glycerol-3-phosphate acyltransferase
MTQTCEAPKNGGLYSVARAAAAILFHTVMPTRIIGAGKLDLEPPFIVISNHNSMMDPFVLACKIKRYPVVFLGKKELVRSRFGRWLFDRLHMISVDRGHSDMEAMRACMRTLKAGGILGVFPEGTRHHEGVMEHIESGVSLIALRSGVPVIPVYIDGRVALFHSTKAWVGDPIPTGDLRAEGINSETSARMNERIRETFRAMVAEHGK